MSDLEIRQRDITNEQLQRLADAVEALVKLMAPVSIEVNSTPPGTRPYHTREEVAAEVEAMLPVTAERIAEGMGITVHGLYRALVRAGRRDLWGRLGREYVR